MQGSIPQVHFRLTTGEALPSCKLHSSSHLVLERARLTAESICMPAQTLATHCRHGESSRRRQVRFRRRGNCSTQLPKLTPGWFMCGRHGECWSSVVGISCKPANCSSQPSGPAQPTLMSAGSGRYAGSCAIQQLRRPSACLLGRSHCGVGKLWSSVVTQC